MRAARVHLETETGTIDWIRAKPPAALQPYIDDLQWYAQDGAATIQRQFPSGRLPLIISLANGMGVALPGESPDVFPQVHSFVAGLHSTFTDTDMGRRWTGLQVNFTPLGARRFLGMPMAELTNRTVELPELLGREGRVAVERLSAAKDQETCLKLLGDFIGGRMAQGPDISEAIGWAWQQLDRDPATDIGWLGGQLGWSRKQMAARFREEIGMTPKLVARVLRFARANTMASRSERPCWSDIALACGYYDQSHLVRDFQAFTGMAPTGYLEHVVAMPRVPGEDD